MRYRLVAVAAAGTIALTAAAWPGTAGTVRAQPPPARTCTAGTITYTLVPGPPGVLTSWWISNGCGQYQSPAILDTSGVYHYGTWRTGVGTNYKSTASTPDALSKAWNRYKNSANGQRYCHRVYPTQGASWFACDATP